MREGKFIDKNVDRWKDYLETTDDPDEQANRFIHLIDDLSYAKTFYPQSKTTQFINGLAAKQFQYLYQNKKQNYSRLYTFWKFELPLLFGKYHRIYLFTFSFFLLCVIIGVIASIHNQDFVRSILGDGYVDMTEENICIADFGLSTFANVEEYLFSRCGTPGFVAPEVVNLKDMKKKYDIVCDEFSIGIIFHILYINLFI